MARVPAVRASTAERIMWAVNSDDGMALPGRSLLLQNPVARGPRQRHCCRIVRRKTPLILTLIAWLFATGSHWDLVQAFAWARMFAENAQTMPVLAALDRTFRPDERCSLCKAVSSGRSEQESPGLPEQKFEGKVVLTFEPEERVIIDVPRFAAWPVAADARISVDRAAPPLRPPRV